MPEDNPILSMSVEELRQFVIVLEEKYNRRTLPSGASAGGRPQPPVTLDDLAQIRASLQRSIAHLDRLLVDWDQAHGRY